jgi:hypothetical protein
MYDNDQLYVGGAYTPGLYDTPSLKFGSIVIGKGAANYKSAKIAKRHKLTAFTSPIYYVYDNFLVYVNNIERNWLRKPKKISFIVYSVSQNKNIVQVQDMDYADWVRDFVTDKMYMKTWFNTKEGNISNYLNL